MSNENLINGQILSVNGDGSVTSVAEHGPFIVTQDANSMNLT